MSVKQTKFGGQRPKTLNMRIPPELLDALREDAKAHAVSINLRLCQMIWDGLDLEPPQEDTPL